MKVLLPNLLSSALASLALAAGAGAAVPMDFPAPTRTQASTGIFQRCQADDGTAIYTDKSCASFHAQPTAVSASLLSRIAADASLTIPSGDVSPNAYPDAAGASLHGHDAMQHVQMTSLGDGRARGEGCARTPRQLSHALVRSFALHDVNRVAENYHWAGMSHGQAMPVMRQLERLAQRPLSDARFLAAWIGPGDSNPADIPDDAGLMQLVFADGAAPALDFDVRRHSDCYFISFRA